MRILFAAPRYHTNHCGMVEGLIAGGDEVAFIASARSREEYHHPQVRFSHVGSFIEALRAAAAFKPDLIILREVSALTVALALFAKLTGRAALYYDQSPIDGAVRSFLPYRMLRLYRFLRAFGVMPKYRISTAYGPPPVPAEEGDFIPFAMAPSPQAADRAYQSQPVRILSIGKFSQTRKNHLLLLDALLPELKSGRAHLTIAGVLHGDDHAVYQNILDKIAREEISGGVKIHVNLPYLEARALYDAHDIFVLPSSREPASISPLEAMAAALPVICSTENGTNYFIREGETGFLFRADDGAHLREVLLGLINAPEEISRMGRAALARVLENFLPAHFHARLHGIYARRFGNLPRARIETSK